MAGPSYLSVGQVVDPYAGAQKALSQVGEIYSQFYDNTKKAEEANALRIQREELQRARDNQLARKEFMQNFDPRLAVDGRGIDNDLYARSQEEEKVLKAENLVAYNAGNKDAIEPAEFARRLDEARKGLVTNKAASDLISEEILRTGMFSPEEASLLTPFYTKGATDVAALVAASQTASDTAWNRYESIYKLPLEIQEAYLKDDANQAKVQANEISRLNALSRTSGSNTVGGGYQTKRPSDLDIKGQNEFRTWGEENIGGWVNVDGRGAENNVFGSARNINAGLAEAGWPRETFVTTGETAQFAINNVKTSWLGRSLHEDVKSPHGFEAKFSAQAGLPPRKAGGGFVTPQEYQAQGNDPSSIMRSRNGSSGGYGRISSPALTGIRPELIAAVQNIPEYKTKSKEDIHKEMIDKVYKNLRLNVAGPKTEDEKNSLWKNINEAASKAGSRLNSLVGTPLGNAIAQAKAAPETKNPPVEQPKDPVDPVDPVNPYEGISLDELQQRRSELSKQISQLNAQQAMVDAGLGNTGVGWSRTSTGNITELQEELDSLNTAIEARPVELPKPPAVGKQGHSDYLAFLRTELDKLPSRGKSLEQRGDAMRLRRELSRAVDTGKVPENRWDLFPQTDDPTSVQQKQNLNTGLLKDTNNLPNRSSVSAPTGGVNSGFGDYSLSSLLSNLASNRAALESKTRQNGTPPAVGLTPDQQKETYADTQGVDDEIAAAKRNVARISQELGELRETTSKEYREYLEKNFSPTGTNFINGVMGVPNDDLDALTGDMTTLTSPVGSNVKPLATPRGMTADQGVVYDTNKGDPIKTVRSGQVKSVERIQNAGTTVVVEHDDGTLTTYTDWSDNFNVSEGDWVKAGQELMTASGLRGKTRFTVYDKNGNRLSPLDWLKENSSNV